MKPEKRPMLVEGIEELATARDATRKLLRIMPTKKCCDILILSLRMLNAEILKYRKAVQVIDGELSEVDFIRWHVAETDTRRRRLLSIREFSDELADTNDIPFSSFERQILKAIRDMVRERSIFETHYYDQISTAWKEIEVNL